MCYCLVKNERCTMETIPSLSLCFLCSQSNVLGRSKSHLIQHVSFIKIFFLRVENLYIHYVNRILQRKKKIYKLYFQCTLANLGNISDFNFKTLSINIAKSFVNFIRRVNREVWWELAGIFILCSVNCKQLENK